ncbi:MTOR-associated protein MEAK7-like [Acipenser ruthenus]|uniref:MTOR-associated protein MEAK7-like n=1 Tax=Acipenser ruthenus TaxID=7906 RepID=UPI002740D582|nr:MTOR-associated protein MEAK7-like [Acipenser ruthenus]
MVSGSQRRTEKGTQVTEAKYEGMGGQHNYFGLWVDSNFGTQQGQALVYHLQQPSTLCQGRLGELMPWRCGCWGTSGRRTFQDKEEHFRC